MTMLKFSRFRFSLDFSLAVPGNAGRSLGKPFFALLLLAMPLQFAVARAAPWLEGGDRSLRHDVELLAARGLVRGPVTTWPIPAGVFAGLRDDAALNGQPLHVQTAARRVLARLNGPSGTRPGAEIRLASAPNVIRDFGDVARDEADFRVGLNHDSARFAANLRVGGISGLDGEGWQPTLDGSWATALLGHWQVYGGLIDKWYGAGAVSSLILSNNARPYPRIGITRNHTEGFETKWLSWLGPWQLDFSIGLLEEDSRQIRDTWLGTLRFEFMPVQGFTVGLTRTVQFCGQGLDCNPLKAAFDPRNDPENVNSSNDQATIEFKYVHDFNVLSVSPYVQFLNDDTGPFINYYTSYLGGVQWLGPWGTNGATWGFTAEYADTRATDDWFEFGDRLPGFSYNNTQYLDGSRYRGRTLGASLDADSVLISFVGSFTDPGGWHYRLAYHDAQINSDALANRRPFPNYVNTVSSQPVRIHQIEGGISLPWQGLLFDLSARWQDATPFPDRGAEWNVEAGVQFRF